MRVLRTLAALVVAGSFLFAFDSFAQETRKRSGKAPRSEVEANEKAQEAAPDTAPDRAARKQKAGSKKADRDPKDEDAAIGSGSGRDAKADKKKKKRKAGKADRQDRDSEDRGERTQGGGPPDWAPAHGYRRKHGDASDPALPPGQERKR